MASRLMEIYKCLYEHFGPQGWWPAESPTEMIIGAILVQHASWRNVELAIDSLKSHDMLDFEVILECEPDHLTSVIRSAGSARSKAQRLRAFAAWLREFHGGDLHAMFSTSLPELRASLLLVKGIGPETADCILLYAGELPTFAVDTYTHRLLVRHLLADPEWNYPQLQEFLESNLEQSIMLYNEFHALFVAIGKSHCRKQASCNGCPLEHLPHQIDT